MFSRFENAITLARNNIFSIRKNFLIAGMLLYQKQSKIENRPRTPLPGPLNTMQVNATGGGGGGGAWSEVNFEILRYVVELDLNFQMLCPDRKKSFPSVDIAR